MILKISMYMVFETRDGKREGLGAYQNIDQAYDKIKERKKLHADAKHDIQECILPRPKWNG